jgi:hypothetical protein
MKYKQPIGHIFKKHNKMTLVAAACLLIGNGAAEAAVVMTLSESGGNVNLVASGTLNMAAISANFSGGATGFLKPNDLYLTTLGSGFADTSIHNGVVGPTSFGLGSIGFAANSGSGDALGVFGSFGGLIVPRGYVSGAPLSGTSTWSGQTFSSMGVTPGTYVYSWGAGATADTLTINVGAAVPEPSSSLLGLVGALSLLRRRRR